jgi:hypothetical protein
VTDGRRRDPLPLSRRVAIRERRDQDRLEWIKRFHRTGEGLWTKLVNAGNPYALARLGLVEAVGTHIGKPEKFAKTHFLSFTSDEATALRYAQDPAPEDADDIDKASYPDETWRHTRYAVFRFQVSQRKRLENGLYLLRYNSDMNAAILVHAAEYLSALPASLRNSDAFRDATNYATLDSEWLVLPADPLQDGTLTACLKKGSDLVADHYVTSDFFIDRQGGFL